MSLVVRDGHPAQLHRSRRYVASRTSQSGVGASVGDPDHPVAVGLDLDAVAGPVHGDDGVGLAELEEAQEHVAG